MTLCICVSSLKGGVGKSTISLAIAGALHVDGKRAIVVDVDPQRTCASWAARASEAEHDGPPVVSCDAKALRRDLARIVAGCDVAIVDSPPRLGAETRAAMLAADLVLMPTIPGAADVWALRETLAVFGEARTVRDDLRGAVVLNRSRRTTLTTLTARVLRELDPDESVGVTVLDAALRDRVAFGEAMLAGLSVAAYAPSSDAAREVRTLVRAVLAAASTAAQVAA
jgi:chromosome partitioning protein